MIDRDGRLVDRIVDGGYVENYGALGALELAVAIRTFWLSDGVLRFGTGAGITWDSEAAQEWAETELKAATLLRVASGSTAAT